MGVEWGWGPEAGSVKAFLSHIQNTEYQGYISPSSTALQAYISPSSTALQA